MSAPSSSALRALLLGCLLLPACARAHSTGESYLRVVLRPKAVRLTVELSVRDVGEHLGLPLPETPVLADAAAAAPILQPWIADRLRVFADETPVALIPLGGDGLSTEAGGFLRYYFQGDWENPPRRLSVEADFFLDESFTHRVLVLLEKDAPGEEASHTVAVLSPKQRRVELDPSAPPTPAGIAAFIGEGMHHIWIGYDHLLFLAVLLLPAVLRRQGAEWAPAGRFRDALLRIVRIVTLFTLAHSVTLTLAATGAIRIPSRWVESAIALSIAAAARNNLRPAPREASAFLILGFGLFHGMGFASVLAELPFRRQDLARAMLGFNAGVEIGQLAVVAVLFPTLYALRERPGYRRVALRGLSGVSCALALFWFVQRAFLM